jgi:hypothetical protein
MAKENAFHRGEDRRGTKLPSNVGNKDAWTYTFTPKYAFTVRKEA